MNTLPARLFTVTQVKAAEAAYSQASGSGDCYELMKRAGAALVKAIDEHQCHGMECLIFCGSGNNGGDGYAAGQILFERGSKVRLFSCAAPHEGTEAQKAYRDYISAGGRVESELPSIEEARSCVIIDALLGTGITSAPREKVSNWIAFINRTQAKVFAADCPSGVNADTGFVPGDCVNADYTVCMLALKPGLFTGDAVDYTGEIIFNDLQCDLSEYIEDISRLESHNLARVQYANIIDDLPIRLKSSNKGDNGKVLIIAGAFDMGGAAIMAGIGALRAGAGLVKIATDPNNNNAIKSVHPELMTVDFNNLDAVKKAIAWADTVAIGPGLGLNNHAQALLDMVIDSGVDTIADADALTLLSKMDDTIAQENRIITPHPGEAGRLLGISADDVNADRFDAARQLQAIYGGIVLLKGAGTIVCSSKHLAVVTSGSPALATGGSGDLLTGMIAALSAGELSLRQAAICGACIHGMAGEMAAEEFGPVGTLPTDLEAYIRRLINGRVRV